jgi:vitamin B12/bleomycin/antimicrobial peptide transport system ATP-binding/permease protein
MLHPGTVPPLTPCIADKEKPVSRLFSSLATVWRLVRPYFFSDERLSGRLLLGAVIAIELMVVAINVMLNQWNNRFYTALQERNSDAFVNELLFFCGLATAFIVLKVYQIYLNQWLEIRWRRWMTAQYLDHWLAGGNHFRMQLLGDVADNPDQRIAEDIRLFIERTLTLSVGLLSAFVTLCSFVVILWSLSSIAPLYLFGTTLSIPGYLVWAALLYAVAGTALTHLVGWPLVSLNFQQQRFEADFRFNLVRVRENSEQIALLGGEAAERGRLLDRFSRIVANWLSIMHRTKRLTFLTSGYSQISIIFPFIVVGPAYFAGAVQLGGLMQTGAAFNSVQVALSFFVEAYRQLAEWRAVIARLDGFNAAVERAQHAATAEPLVKVRKQEGARGVAVDGLVVHLPEGKPVVAAHDIVVSQGDSVLVTGPSGAGKSTLVRAIAGAWPFGVGTITVPRGAKLMALPQRPYFPIGTLAAAVTYPAEPGSFKKEEVAEAISAVGLPEFAQRLEEEAHWNRILSLGEQQRLGIARAILQKPDFLFLDEATASLDEPAEAALYRLLDQRLTGTTIVSIGHRSTLSAFHRRGLTLVRHGEHFRMRETSLEPASL